MRRLVAVLGIVLALATVGLGGQREPARSRFQEIYEAYVAGDTGVVQRSIRRPEDLAAIRGDLFNAVGRWKGTSDRRSIVFLLEVATVGLLQPWAPPQDALRAMRDLLAARPARIGQVAADDEFELLAHHVAVTMLLGSGFPDDVERYVASVAGRVAATSEAVSGTLSAPRFLIYPAFAAEIRSRATGAAGGVGRPALVRAADLYERAAKEPDNLAEARVRRAFLLHRMGESANALLLLEPSTIRTPDRVPEFWRLMVRGKAEEALARVDVAERTYREAATMYPEAQTPLVALSALLMAGGRTDEAHLIAATARRQAPKAYDPWWDYWSSDMRFFTAWMQELRRLAVR